MSLKQELMNVFPISALKDNYIWILHNKKKECIIVDPGESSNTIRLLTNNKFIPKAILLTHYHNDHVNGVNALKNIFPKIIIYGPEEIKNQKIDYIVSEGEKIDILGHKFIVLNQTGHTKKHIGFYTNLTLFCGDTLFSVGCGKVEKGLEKKMYESLKKIKNLPENTLIYSGHEYTLSNVQFALSIFPKNNTLIKYQKKIIELRKKNLPTLPTNLKLEKKINPFLCCDDPNIKNSLNLNFPEIEEWEVFYKLRRKKDDY